MALETGTYISDLVSTNPASSDNISQGDDHIRLLKSTIKATFPNAAGPIALASAGASGAAVISVTDNTNAALRITQLGTADAIRVEDSTNPDSTPFIVDASGNVGIGTASPSNFGGTNLQVQNSNIGSILWSNGTITGQLLASASAEVTVGSRSNHPLRFGTNDTERMRIDSSGNVLVGYTSSNGAYKLQVNSQIFATSATIATSDGRYKENVTPLNGALDLVSALNPVQFSWKQHAVHNFDREQPTVGFIAQEVQQVLADKPYLNSIVKSNTCTIELEEKDEEGNVTKAAVTEEFLGIAEGNMIAILTKAIQELKAEFDAYKAAHP